MIISRWKIMAFALAFSLGGLAFVAGPLNSRLNAQFDVAAQPSTQPAEQKPSPQQTDAAPASPVAEKPVSAPTPANTAPAAEQPREIEIIFPVEAPPAPIAPMKEYDPILIPAQAPMAGETPPVRTIINLQVPSYPEEKPMTGPETLPAPQECMSVFGSCQGFNGLKAPDSPPMPVAVPMNVPIVPVVEPVVVVPMQLPVAPVVEPVHGSTEKKEEVVRLIKEFCRLMEEGKFQQAGKVALKAKEIDPENPVVIAAMRLCQMRKNGPGDRTSEQDFQLVSPVAAPATPPQTNTIQPPPSATMVPVYPLGVQNGKPMMVPQQTAPPRGEAPWDVTGEESVKEPLLLAQATEVPSGYTPGPQYLPPSPPTLQPAYTPPIPAQQEHVWTYQGPQYPPAMPLNPPQTVAPEPHAPLTISVGGGILMNMPPPPQPMPAPQAGGAGVICGQEMRVTVVAQPAPVQQAVATTTTTTSKLKMLVRLGDGKPRFEIRNSNSTDLLFKVYGEKVEMQSAPEGMQNSPIAGVTAVGQVRFVGPGVEGTCDQLSVLSGTGEVLLKGNVHMKTKHGKSWNEVTSEKMIYQIATNGVSTTSSSSGVQPASYSGR